MTKQRRQVDISLKPDVVRMIREQGLTTTRVSLSMDIGETFSGRSATRLAGAGRHHDAAAMSSGRKMASSRHRCVACQRWQYHLCAMRDSGRT